jgi:tetratricopeptide (TPR) repeat protein
LEIRKRLAKANPQTYEPDIADSQNNLGFLYSAKNDYSRAEAAYLEALEIREKWAALYPKVFEKKRIQVILNLKDLYEKWVDTLAIEAEKVTPQQKLCGLYENIVRKYPNDKIVKNGYPPTLGNLAWYCLFARQYPEAQAAAEKSLALDPAQNWVRTNLGHSHLLRGEWGKAKAVYEEYLKNEPDPAEAKKNLAKDWDDLEKAGVTHKDMEKARAWARE